MTNNQLIYKFMNGDVKSGQLKVNNLRIEPGNKENSYILYNYNTPILYVEDIDNPTFLLNETKYSLTTSKIQNTIKLCDNTKYKINCIDENTLMTLINS